MKFRFSLTVLLIGLSFPARAEVLGTIETEQDDGSLSVIEILDEPPSVAKCDGAHAVAVYVKESNFSLPVGKGCWKLLGSAEMLKLEIVLSATEEHVMSGVPLNKITFDGEGQRAFQELMREQERSGQPIPLQSID
ncbi:hypothetical protein [Brucella intermedia]|uniref:hypothetical protein n=1 Tax=Brucella intermedia TaxID=94625 RepID=UPI00124CCA6E|nr:hypothetical protein [Brucella intermedia]KAB2718542.1 hypothetical protein F9K75_08475 [Brucella intermedia]